MRARSPYSSGGMIAAPRSFVLVLLLTLAAAIADQAAVPAFFSTSPICAVLACLLLVLRRAPSAVPADGASSTTKGRIALFLVAHVLLGGSLAIVANSLLGVPGSLSVGGWLFLFVKLAVLVPTILLLPWKAWRTFARCYAAEFGAAFVVLVSFFPRRIVEAVWPWYGQFLAHAVYFLAWPFVHGLGLLKALYPTLTGPSLDVTILLSCSGVNGMELFDILFAAVVFCDWNRLNKRRVLIAYGAGVAIMVFSNVLRITSFMVIGNNGFAEVVSRFHVNAGWLFFSSTFLLYLSFAYRWMLERPSLPELNSTGSLPSALRAV